MRLAASADGNLTSQGDIRLADLDFGASISMLKNALDGAGLSHEAIANNIANVNTPHFRRTDVTFKEALAATEGTPPDPNQLAMAITNPADIDISGAASPQPYKPSVSVDSTTKMRVDGSNVDIDQEMAELAQNSGYSQTMAQLLQVQFMRLREGIQEHP